MFNLLRTIWKIRCLETFLVLITKGKVYGSTLSKLPPNHYQYKAGSIRNVERRGIHYRLDISDIMAWFIYFGFTEKAKMRLYKLVSKGDTVIDVGANLGETSLNFANLVGPQGKVHSFEPDPINLKLFRFNLNLNFFENITISPFGLGNETGKFQIQTIDEHNKGMNRIISEPIEYEGTREVEITTLDEYMQQHTINKLNLIKIDVEGFELNVLKGAIQTIKSYSPILFIELDDENLREQQSSAKELVVFLKALGYQIVNAETNNAVLEDSDFSHCHYDIIATIPSS